MDPGYGKKGRPMKMIRRFLSYFLLTTLIVLVIYAWPRLPIITGFAAKGMCSGVFVGHRAPEDVAARELSFFPISLARTHVDMSDSSVTASLWGLARRKAVWRPGLGCALVADLPEEEVRARRAHLPPPPYDPDTVAWPRGDLLPPRRPATVDTLRLDSLVQAAFDTPGEEPVKKTLAVVVVCRDTLVAEAYAPGISRQTPLLGWSMTKSIINALVALRANDLALDLTAPAPVEAWKDDERHRITPVHLLHMTSGLKWTEDYFDISDVTRMLYVHGDMYGYAVSVPAAYPPDSVWYYSSGSTNILSGILRHTFPDDGEYYCYPYRSLFYRTGMLHTTMEADAAGTFVGSSYSYAPARDWARFGLLYLHDGVFCGDTILPEGWVPLVTRRPAPHSEGHYSAQWWLNEGGRMPHVPEDVFYCDGFQGQRVFVIPSRDAVVVRLGWSMKEFDMDRFLSDILSTLPQ